MMDHSTKRLISLILGVIVSALLLWKLFYEINFEELGENLKNANYFWVIPNVLMIFLTMYQRAYRWKFMIDPIKKVEFRKLMSATCVGFMSNNILPARLGEFVRAYSLSRQDNGVSKSASLATIFVERIIFDLIALLLIFGAVLTFSESLRNQLESNLQYADTIILGSKTAIIFVIVGLGSMIVLALKPSQVGNLLTKYLFFLPQKVNDFIRSIIDKFSQGLLFLKDFKAVFHVSLQTMLIWILMGVSNYFVFIAFGFDITFDASFVLLVIVSIMIMAPSTPGFVGVYHAGVVFSLEIYGIQREEALACAIVLHAAQYIMVTLLGIYYLLTTDHISLKELQKTAEEEN